MNALRIMSFFDLAAYVVLMADSLNSVESLCIYVLPAFAVFAAWNLLLSLIGARQQAKRRNEIYSRVMEERRKRLMKQHREERRSQFSFTERKAG